MLPAVKQNKQKGCHQSSRTSREATVLPQQRSLKMSVRSDWRVLELMVATAMFKACNAATWLFMRASKGDTTIVMPWSMTAGSWKHKLLLVTSLLRGVKIEKWWTHPKEVAVHLQPERLIILVEIENFEEYSPAWTKTSWPSRAAVMISRWYGLLRVRWLDWLGKKFEIPKIDFTKCSPQGELNISMRLLYRSCRHLQVGWGGWRRLLLGRCLDEKKIWGPGWLS